MALTIVATFKAKPETAERLIQELQALAVLTREEEGCISYRPYVDPEDPTAIVMVETWADAGAIEGHNKSDHFQVFIKTVPDLVAAPVAIEVLKPAKD
jgi:quinol monooxygenase YgiN